TAGRNPRSTVGTITEIYDFLRLLFARAGTPWCPDCHVPVESITRDTITDVVMENYQSVFIFIMAPVIIIRKGEYRKDLEKLKNSGFIRVRINGEIRELENEIKLGRYEKHTIEAVIDRVSCTNENRRRISESISRALDLADGKVSVIPADENGSAKEKYSIYSTKTSCPSCGHSIPKLEPPFFSFIPKSNDFASFALSKCSAFSC
ncbi:MAG TPA: excinuclease ABC subunit UvrA, partial [Spirochaetia bacterium]|nr:excinuclease ABC subunit UvrA [Spirochaetia bacterium]